jgi:hypothetical protein
VIKAVGDAFEQHLRIEIASDTPERVEAYSGALCELLLSDPFNGKYDVMITIHDCTHSGEAK